MDRVNFESLNVFCLSDGTYRGSAKIGNADRSVEFKMTDAEIRVLLRPLAAVIASATARYSGLIAADIVAALNAEGEESK